MKRWEWKERWGEIKEEEEGCDCGDGNGEIIEERVIGLWRWRWDGRREGRIKVEEDDAVEM
jgi:hypothetical protein